jgi:hypothetical protein
MGTEINKYGCAIFALMLAIGLGAGLSDKSAEETQKANVKEPQKVSNISETMVEKPPADIEESKNLAPPRSIDNEPGVADAQNAVATLINLNGQLCAQVVNVQPLQVRDQVFEVTCTEYRGGTGKVRYLVDGSTGTASRL